MLFRSWLADHLGIVFAFRWTGAALACGVMSFPLLVRPIRLSIEAVDRRLEQAAETLGAAPWRVFATVTLPLALPGVLAGMVLLARPMQGVLTLTIVTGAYFVAEGIATIMYALEHRRELSGRWSWLLIAGLMDILVAFFIIAGLPESAGWAIGLLVGLNLMFGGATLIGMALAARNT